MNLRNVAIALGLTLTAPWASATPSGPDAASAAKQARLAKRALKAAARKKYRLGAGATINKTSTLATTPTTMTKDARRAYVLGNIKASQAARDASDISVRYRAAERDAKGTRAWTEERFLPVIPKTRANRRVTVVVASPEHIESADSVRAFLNGPTAENGWAPGVANDVIEAAKFKTVDELRAAVAKSVASSDVLVFFGHANPSHMRMTSSILIEPDFFKGMNLENKVVTFDGCGTGSTAWPEYGPWNVVNPKGSTVPRNESLLEGAMNASNASFMIGFTDLSDNVPHYLQLGLEAGGQRLENVRGGQITRVLRRRGTLSPYPNAEAQREVKEQQGMGVVKTIGLLFGGGNAKQAPAAPPATAQN